MWFKRQFFVLRVRFSSKNLNEATMLRETWESQDHSFHLGSNILGERLIFGLPANGSAAAELVRRTLACALPESIELERRLRGIRIQPEEARKALLQSLSRLVGRTGLKGQDRLRRVPG